MFVTSLNQGRVDRFASCRSIVLATGLLQYLNMNPSTPLLTPVQNHSQYSSQQEEMESFSTFAKNREPMNITMDEMRIQFEKKRLALIKKKELRPYWLDYTGGRDKKKRGDKEDSECASNRSEREERSQSQCQEEVRSENGMEEEVLAQEKWDQPRMVIEKIVLENFKSYGDRVQLNGFRSAFNGIIGPNGSGKSNLIDAMLFIFGYSAKWMRQQKLSNLIHCTPLRPNAKKGYVEVHFHDFKKDNPRQRFAEKIPGTELILRRTVYSNSTSNYELNGKTVNFKDVKNILMKKGIDLNLHRFLILQGQVEQIAMMKPKGNKDTPGLLEFIEQVIGSGSYIGRIDEITEEIQKQKEVQTIQQLALSILQEDLLKHYKEKADSVIFYNHLKKYLKLTELNLQTYLHTIKRDTTSAANVIAKLRNQTKEMMEEEEVREPENQPLLTPQQLNHRFRIMTQKCDEIDAELERLEEKDRFFQGEMKAMIPEFEKEMTKLSEINADEELYSNGIKLAQLRLPAQKQELEIIQKKIAHLEKKFSVEGKIYEIPAEYATNITKLKDLKEKYQRMAQERQKVEEKVLELESQIEAAKTDKIQKEKQLKSLVEKKQLCQTMMVKINEKYQETKENRAGLSNFDKNQKMEQQELRNILEGKKAARNTYMEKFRISQRVRLASIPGVLGRLGNLAACDPEYEEIITSSTPQLDNIVVENYDAAEKVIQFVKAKRLGKVTCLIIQNLREHEYAMNREYHPVADTIRLFDKVRPVSNDAKLAFYSAMRDTLYTKDSNRATDIAFNTGERKRVASFGRGDTVMIIDKTGIMNSFPRKKGGFGSNTFQKDIEVEIKALEQKIAELREKMGDVNDKRKGTMDQLSIIENEYKFTKDQISQLSTQIDKLNGALRDINIKRLGIADNNLRQQGRRLQQINKRLEETSLDLRRIEERNSAIKADIVKNLGPSAFCLKELIEKYRSQRRQLQAQLRKTETRIEGLQKRKEQFNKRKQVHIKRLGVITRDFSKLKLDRRPGQQKGADLFRKQVMLVYKFRLLYMVSVISFARAEVRKALDLFRHEGQEIIKVGQSDPTRPLKQIMTLTRYLAERGRDYNTAYELLRLIRSRWLNAIEEHGFLDEVVRMPIFGDSMEAKDQTFNIAALEPIMPKFQRLREGKEIVEFDAVRVDKKRSPEELEIIESVLDKLEGEWSQQLEVMDKLGGKNESILLFREKYKAFAAKQKDLLEALRKKEVLIEELVRLSDNRLRKFNYGFDKIKTQLKKVYAELSFNGDIEIASINRVNPFESGLLVRARPPRKTWKEMNKLSGGEKTLTSLSLIFALHGYKPSPIYLMDEIDAALDVHNTEVIAQYILRHANTSQFIVISLRPDTFVKCDDLAGIIKYKDMTTAVMLPTRPAVEEAQEEYRTVWLPNGNTVYLYKKETIDIRMLWDPSQVHIIRNQNGEKKVLREKQRKRWLWGNILELRPEQSDFWLQRHGWFWKRKDKIKGLKTSDSSSMYVIVCENTSEQEVRRRPEIEYKQVDIALQELGIGEQSRAASKAPGSIVVQHDYSQEEEMR